MRNKVIDLLDQTIEELDKEKIDGILEIPPKDFYEKRSVLENKLTKEFSIERWKTNAVVIQTMIEM